MAYIFTHGSGTAEDPYLVETAADLDGVRDYLSAHFKQVADIDLSGYANWEPIGENVYGKRFTGLYDGNNHEITNLTIAGENSLAGLFSAVLWATLKNIKLRNVDISLNHGSRGYCAGGGLAALFSSSTAANCSITGDISVKLFGDDEVAAGGLFGCCGGETPGIPNIITDCLNACSVSCSASSNERNTAVSGGIVGLCEGLTITNCYNIGNISASANNYGSAAGGLVGYGYPVEATNCFNQGNVSGEVLEGVIDGGLCVVGGFSGLAMGKIINCYSTGSILGVSPSNPEIGGLVGFFHSDELYKDGEKSCVISSYYDTQTSGQSDTGKGDPKTTAEMKQQATFVDWDFDTVWAMDSSINDGYPCLQWQIPPPIEVIEVWTAEDLNNVRNNLSGRYIQMADIDLSGYENWEPIGTYVDEQELEFRGIYDGNGHTIKHLKINLIDREWVGLFGVTDNAVIKNLDLIDVDVSGVSGGRNEDGDWVCGSIVGALAGLVFRNTDIINCRSTGNVTGGEWTGGLAGHVIGSNISDCRSSASVTGGMIAGGLIGVAYGYDDPDIGNDYCYVSSCYCTGSVTSYLDREEENIIGGLVGAIDMGYFRVFDCYSASTLLNGCYGGGLFGAAFLERETEEYNVLNCYSICDISGGVASGGLIGLFAKEAGITFTICNCYSASSLSGMVAVGGLIAYPEIEGGEPELENIIIISSYYDSNKVPEYEGGLHIDKGEPKTTAEMQTQSTYTDWDFASVWGINPAVNDGYPYLQWETPPAPPPEPFQPWTPPKLEPSWWEGFKLPFNVLELDEDAPIAIQRNFKEIEHYINFLGRSAGEIKDSLELLATAPGPASGEELPDIEPETPPTDSYFAGYLLGKEGQMGSIDAAIKTDSLGGINEVWIARVIDKQGIVEIYDSDAPEHIFRTVAREFNLPLVNLGADVVDVAIEFDGTYDQYNIFVSETEPHIFWVERTANEDIIYTIKWDGVDPAPIPVELARANLGNMGNGINAGIDPNITV